VVNANIETSRKIFRIDKQQHVILSILLACDLKNIADNGLLSEYLQSLFDSGCHNCNFWLENIKTYLFLLFVIKLFAILYQTRIHVHR
jgi:hypothetical protein